MFVDVVFVIIVHFLVFMALHWGPKNNYDRVPAKKKLADESFSIYCFLVLLFCPKLLDVFKHHVAMSVEGLYTRDDFVIVS